MFKLNKKIKKNRGLPMQAGMTYVELIVVLSIFSLLSSVAIYNYNDFQAKIDLKNLATDIALKVVEAQKSSLSGKLPTFPQQASLDWKPSYGLYFDSTNANNKKSFIYFTDLNNNNLFDDSNCSGECLNYISITKNNSISRLDVFYQDGTNSLGSSNGLDNLTITFARPNSGTILKSISGFISTISYVQITIISPKAIPAIIKIYPSGRIQVN